VALNHTCVNPYGSAKDKAKKQGKPFKEQIEGWRVERPDLL